MGFDVHRCLNGGGVTLELVAEEVDQTSARGGGVGVLQEQVPTSCFGNSCSPRPKRKMNGKAE